MAHMIVAPALFALLLSSSVPSVVFAAGASPMISPSSVSPQKSGLPGSKASQPPQPKKPEIGAISRSTGHLFREGLASGIAADRVEHPTAKQTASTNANNHGLLATKKDGSLGDHIWDNIDPATFAEMINKLQPNPQIPTLNPLARRLLLTDSSWPIGADLRAVRLEKMIAFGAVDEAAHLYNFWSPDSSNIRLNRIGIETMYRTGQTATACLEINANPAIAKSGDDFWDKAKQSCATLKFDAAPSKTGQNETVTRILSPLPPDLRTQIIALYADQSASGPNNATTRAGKILPLFKDLPWSARALFAPTFIVIPADYTSKPEEIRMILGTLLAANASESGSWVKKLRDSLPNPLVSDPEAASLLLLAQMRGIDPQKLPIPFKFEGINDATGYHQAKLFIKLTELLDTAPNFIDNPPVTYEKKKGLTQADHYVMPVEMLRSHLSKGNQNGSRGSMLLASLLSLQLKDVGTIDPDLFSDIIGNLMSAGLNEEARQIVTYVFLGASRLGE